MFSNSSNPLYLERNSRRIHVVNRLTQKVRDPAYYDTVFKWLNDGGAAVCAAYLLTLPLSDAEKAEFKGLAPSTADKTELEEQNVDPALAALEDMITDARAEIAGDTPHTLIASAEELAELIKLKPNLHHRAPSARTVSAWLRTMPGVHRFRLDPKNPTHCAVISCDRQRRDLPGALVGAQRDRWRAALVNALRHRDRHDLEEIGHAQDRDRHPVQGRGRRISRRAGMTWATHCGSGRTAIAMSPWQLPRAARSGAVSAERTPATGPTCARSGGSTFGYAVRVIPRPNEERSS